MSEKFKFKPDKADDGSPLTNGQRARAAAFAVTMAVEVKQDDILDPPIKPKEQKIDYDLVVDLLSDIAHLADREGWDFEDMLDTVRMHWRAER